MVSVLLSASPAKICVAAGPGKPNRRRVDIVAIIRSPGLCRIGLSSSSEGSLPDDIGPKIITRDVRQLSGFCLTSSSISAKS
jgi:hypothetical protein